MIEAARRKEAAQEVLDGLESGLSIEGYLLGPLVVFEAWMAAADVSAEECAQLIGVELDTFKKIASDGKEFKKYIPQIAKVTYISARDWGKLWSNFYSKKKANKKRPRPSDVGGFMLIEEDGEPFWVLDDEDLEAFYERNRYSGRGYQF